MNYAIAAQLEERLGALLFARLTDRVNGTTADASVAEQAIDEAEAEVNSYIAARFATPVALAEHPELAGTLAARTLDVAEYLLWKASPFVNDLPNRVKSMYSDAIRWLRALASGAVQPPAAQRPADTPLHSPSPEIRAPARRFTAPELDGL